MPASMTELLGNRRRVDIPKADGSPGIYVIYKPQSFTARKLHELLSMEQTLQEAQEAHAAQVADDEEANDDNDAAPTEAQWKSLRAAVGTADDLLADFAAILIDWDLLDDHGNPIPPTLEGVQEVDLDVIRFIWGKVREDAQMGKPNGTPSSTPSASTSSRKGTQAQTTTSRPRSPRGSRG